eukprot:TRINITY_DN15220_c0_g1_i1.p1 TRINITY_DN15220_c0_g1~~TRINITY_DN15220_c0_g1_i1.p1  ORF type:complete len:388 (+),score=58.38 TRINITY_DN15220_c0_g1_i1:204-1367(+)
MQMWYTVMLLLVIIAAFIPCNVYGQRCSCQDIPPPKSWYTCAQQKKWGKCTETWMKGWCECTCGLCSISDVLESPKAEGVTFAPQFSPQRLFDNFLLDPSNLPEQSDGVYSPVKLNDTSEYPFNLIGQLGNVCTAALVGPCQIITAAHCLLEPESKTWWSDFDGFTPGRNGKSAWNPFGKAGWVKTFVTDEWKAGLGTPYDIGMVLLDRRIGDQVGWFELDYVPQEIVLGANSYGDLEGVVKETLSLLSTEFYSSRELQQKISDVQKAELARILRTRRIAMNLAGYPTVNNDDVMVYEYCKGVSVDYSGGMLLLHICEAGKGVSGGPLWINQGDGNRTIKAIHGGEVYLRDNNPEIVGSYAVMITPTIYDKLNKWMQTEARCPPPQM